MITGSCLCGAVKLDIMEPLEHAPEACHCVQCRKQTGSYFMGVNMRRSALHVQGSEAVRWYRSSDKVQRGFCGVCGSTLFWQPVIDGYPWTSVALGCLDTPLAQGIAKHTFVSEKGSYYSLCDGVPQLEKF